jgi:hypothetical protein
MGLRYMGKKGETKLSFEGASEFYWQLLIEGLQ